MSQQAIETARAAGSDRLKTASDPTGTRVLGTGATSHLDPS